MIGSIGDVAAFSLNAFKNLGAGDGGLLVTNDEEYYEQARMIREFGERIYKGKRREYNAYAMGWMYRTTEFVGAFARSQLQRLDEMNAARIRNAQFLRKALAGYEFASFPQYETKDRTCVYWWWPFMVSAKAAGYDLPDAEFRDKICQAAIAEGLRLWTWQRMPVPAQRLFQDRIGYGKGSPWTDGHYKGHVTYRPEDYPVAQAIADRSAWLTNMYFWPQTEADVEYAVNAFRKIFGQLDEVVKRDRSRG